MCERRDRQTEPEIESDEEREREREREPTLHFGHVVPRNVPVRE